MVAWLKQMVQESAECLQLLSDLVCMWVLGVWCLMTVIGCLSRQSRLQLLTDLEGTLRLVVFSAREKFIRWLCP